MEPYKMKKSFFVKRNFFFVEPQIFFVIWNFFFVERQHFFVMRQHFFCCLNLINEKLWPNRALESLTFQKFSSIDCRHPVLHVQELYLNLTVMMYLINICILKQMSRQARGPHQPGSVSGLHCRWIYYCGHCDIDVRSVFRRPGTDAHLPHHLWPHRLHAADQAGLHAHGDWVSKNLWISVGEFFQVFLNVSLLGQ